ncbi:MAG: phasin family protein [Gaiellaceae bacterium]
MADRADLRTLLAESGLAAVGAVALTAERIESLAEEIAARGGLTREEASSLVREQADRWRKEANRIGERASGRMSSLIRELGLVSRDELDELDLRLAQIEHRLHLLEEPRDAS